MLWKSSGLCRQGSDLDPQECSRIWCLLGIRFDRYMEYIIKDNPRNTRQKGASQQHRRTLTMQWTTKGIADSYTKQDPADRFDCRGSREGSDQFKLWWHKLVVTGRDPIPVEIDKGIIIRRCDLKTVPEETDVIIMRQQMIAISEVLDGAGIPVKFDDTDVFVLLLHFYRLREMWFSLNQTSWPHMSVLDLTQWPSVIGKGKLVKVLKGGHILFRRQLHSWQHVVENTSPLLWLLCTGGCGKVKMAVRVIIVSAPKLQSQPQQVNPFCSKQSHPTFKRAFEDTHVRLGLRC